MILSAGLGAVSGIRSMAGLAFLSHHLSRKAAGDGLVASKIQRSIERRIGGRIGPFFTSRRFTAVVSLMAAGEMVADKLPFMPSRTEPEPLFGRAVFGGLSGWLVARYTGGDAVRGTAAGAAAAVAAAAVFTTIRRRVAENESAPDWVVAAAEDVLVLTGGACCIDALGE